MRSRAMSVLAKALAALGLFAVLSLAYPPWKAQQQAIGEQRATVRYNAATQAQNDEAGRVLATEKDRADTATQALKEFTERQDKNDVIEKNKIDELERRVRAAAAVNAGRLRDPYATAASGPGCSGPPGASPSTSGSGTGDASAATGLLSTELSEFLIDKFADAERVSAAYASCKSYAEKLRGAMK